MSSWLNEFCFADDAAVVAATKKNLVAQFNIVSRAATIFGAMRRSVFSDKLLCLQTKRMVYQAVVLGVLLYAIETCQLNKAIHIL